MINRIDTLDRAARLAELKREIAAGRYETEWRLSLALDNFLDQLMDQQTPEQDGTEGGDDPAARPRQPR